ncbi:hypothetical protein SynBIOSU31_02977 [Synechococcus sp. BIOS-U3-1]|nr:hypothetical protein SynBIOSU31_02977 [Synechococcus sp. BIOS-U3-1]
MKVEALVGAALIDACAQNNRAVMTQPQKRLDKLRSCRFWS